MVASKNSFRILGYENFSSDENYELYCETLEDYEEIKYIDFIEDVVPKYLFMIVNDTKAKQSNLYIRLIKKNEAYFNKKIQEQTQKTDQSDKQSVQTHKDKQYSGN